MVKIVKRSFKDLPSAWPAGNAKFINFQATDYVACTRGTKIVKSVNAITGATRPESASVLRG